MYALAFQTDSNHKIVFNQHIFQFLIFSTGHFTNRLDGFEARQNENQIMSSIVAPNASSSIKEIMMETDQSIKIVARLDDDTFDMLVEQVSTFIAETC